MSTQNARTDGEAVMRKLGISPDAVIDSLESLGSDFGETVVEYVFGRIVASPALDLRTRQLVTVAVLTCLGGCEAQLAVHIPATLQAGATVEEIVALIAHVGAYAGVPKAMNGFDAARKAFATAGC